MTNHRTLVHVIGGGLAGSETAWQLARAGVPVALHEMRTEARYRGAPERAPRRARLLQLVPLRRRRAQRRRPRAIPASTSPRTSTAARSASAREARRSDAKSGRWNFTGGFYRGNELVRAGRTGRRLSLRIRGGRIGGEGGRQCYASGVRRDLIIDGVQENPLAFGRTYWTTGRFLPIQEYV